MKEEIFISCMSIMVLFNTFIVFVESTLPTSLKTTSVLTLDLGSIILTALLLGISASITIFGTSLGDAGRMIFIVILLTGIMFNISFEVLSVQFSAGLGLVTTFVNVFNPTQAWGLGYIIALLISFLTYFSGIMIIAENA